MHWIRRNRTRLILVCGLSFAVCAVELFAMRTKGLGASMERHLGLFLLPFTVCAFSYLPLWYLAWFREPRRTAVGAILGLFFWLTAAVMVCVLLQFWGRFVLHLW